MLDYHVILDLLPTLSALYFKRRLIAPKSESGPTSDGSPRERNVKLSSLQRAMLLAIGLQRKTIEEAGEELTLQPNQVLAEFAKIIKKSCAVLQLIQRAAVVNEMPQIAKLSVDDDAMGGQLERMDDELEEAAKEVRRELRAQNAADKEMIDASGVDGQKKARQREFINSLDLSQ
jgi:N-acetyltransferase 10